MIRHGHASLDHADQRLWYAFLAAMAAYFGVHAAVRVLVSPSPELDEAEQLIWTQHRALGYGTQPPLYTWLQALWFDVVGVSVLGLTTFKNGLLWVCHVAVAAALRPIVGTRAAIVAAASMLWLPTIGWESQRDLTHTVLATALAAVGLWLFVRIALHGRWQDYLVFGLVAGAGLLAKYNFMLFLAVLVTAAAGVPALRPRVFTTHTVLSVSVALAVVAPHLLWVLNHWDAASVQTLDKMTAHAGNTAAERLGGAALALLAFATPWWAAFAAALALDRRAGRKRPPPPAPGAPAAALRQWAAIYLGLALAMLAALAAVGASEIKARWLQPLLFLLPALAVLIARVDGAGRAWRGFLGACAALGLTWLVLVGARAAYQMGRASPDEWNLPLPALALALRDAGFSGGVIVSPNAVIAAGLRLQFPDARAVVAAYPLSDAGGQPQVFVQADNHGRPLPPWPLAQPARTVRLAFLYARPDSPLFEARFAVLPAAPAPINDDTP